MRFRITVRGEGIELRGYLDGDGTALNDLSLAFKDTAMVVASAEKDDYNPFAITDPDNPPTPESARQIIEGVFEGKFNIEDVMQELAAMNYMQAMVIRGERHQREQAEAELRERELHHFETEEENARLKANLEQERAEHESTLHVGQDYLRTLDKVRVARSNHPECEKHPDDDTVTCGWKRAVQDIDKALEGA